MAQAAQKEQPESTADAPKTIIEIDCSPIDEVALRGKVAHPSCGAISSFVGVTRDNFKGRPVTHLFYQAYESMALKQLGLICAEARTEAAARFVHTNALTGTPEPAVQHIAVAHRTGRVDIGEASVAIYVSSSHRDASLWAVAFIIDELKARVPIWKQEFFLGEEQGTWKANAECGCARRKAAAPDA